VQAANLLKSDEAVIPIQRTDGDASMVLQLLPLFTEMIILEESTVATNLEKSAVQMILSHSLMPALATIGQVWPLSVDTYSPPEY
jgi:hypothetical protein